MTKAIIVEDERLIREGIASQVAWKDLQVDEVRTAENAEVALTICKDWHPDIIVSDIRMPGMDGIALCTKLRVSQPDAQVIFISGYSDKEYLMSAIGLHAVNYIEKPVSLEAFNEAVRSAVSALEKKRNEKANSLHVLFHSPIGAASDFGFIRNGAAGGNFFLVAVIEGQMPSKGQGDGPESALVSALQALSGCGLQYMTDFISDRLAAVLFISEDEASLDRLYRDEAFWLSLVRGAASGGRLFAGIGTKCDSVDGVRLSYASATEALKCLSFRGWGQYAHSDEPYAEWNVGLDIGSLAEFRNALLEKDERRALDILSGIYGQFIEANTLLSHSVRNAYYLLDDVVEKVYGFTPEEQEEGNFVKEHGETILELHDYLCGKVRVALSDEDTRKASFVVKRIISYIQKNYADKNLSVQSIADAVFLTPTYISCLFKKNTGTTIGQYIQDYRMAKAVELMKDPQYKIYQIADLVGYEDSNYFTRLFKKQTGLKPSDFRAQTE
jgi:two-component system response regulator YesN